MKRQNVGYHPKKSNVLTSEEVTKFMCEARDQQWLLTNVGLSFGIYRACRKDDLINLKVSDVHDSGKFLTVFLKGGKTPKERSFTITNEDSPFNSCDLFRKYKALRPPHMVSDRLFVGYRNGKCVAQNVGCHAVASVPRMVAKYLNLENADSYTGHSLRRSSTTMLVEGGADLLTLKRHGGWQSSTVAEGYIIDSISRKVEVSRKLFKTASKNEAPTFKQNEGNLEMKKKNVYRYLNVDDIFDSSQGEDHESGQVNRPTCENEKENITILQKTLGLGLLNKGLNICNNKDCTININFKI